MLDEGFGIGGQDFQVGYFGIGADVRSEMTTQLLGPDIAHPAPELMFAGLAIGALPAVFDGAVEYQPEKRNLVVEQRFNRVQGGHILEPGTQPEHSGVGPRPACKTGYPCPRACR